MKKKGFMLWGVVLLFLIIAVSQVTAAETSRVEVNIPDFRVEINGVFIDNYHSKYPLLLYKNITYIPLTWNYSSALGLSLNWDENKGLEVKKSGKVNLILQESSITINNNQKYFANIADFQINVNGRVIKNKEEQYPILQFRDITYFPITWKYAQHEFDWQVEWQEEQGLSIKVKGKTTKEKRGESETKEEKKEPFSVELLQRLDDKIEASQSLKLDMTGTMETIFLEEDAAMKMKLYLDVEEKVKLPAELYINVASKSELFTAAKKENALITKEEQVEMYLREDRGYIKTDDEEYWHKINGINKLDVLEEVQDKIDLDVAIYESIGLIPQYAGTEKIDGHRYHVIKGNFEGTNFFEIMDEYFELEDLLEDLALLDQRLMEKIVNNIQGEYTYWVDMEKEEQVKFNINFSMHLPDKELKIPLRMNFTIHGNFDLGESITSPFVRIDKVAEDEVEEILKEHWVKI